MVSHLIYFARAKNDFIETHPVYTIVAYANIIDKIVSIKSITFNTRFFAEYFGFSNANQALSDFAVLTPVPRNQPMLCV